jgi:hypothetical protein
MAKFSKPANVAFVSAKTAEISADLQKVKQKDFKSPPNHM